MEQKRPADIIQELLDYLWNGLGLEEKGWKRLKKGDFKKKMKNGLTYQIWFDRSRYNYIDYEIGHGNVEVGFSCIIKQGDDYLYSFRIEPTTGGSFFRMLTEDLRLNTGLLDTFLPLVKANYLDFIDRFEADPVEALQPVCAPFTEAEDYSWFIYVREQMVERYGTAEQMEEYRRQAELRGTPGHKAKNWMGSMLFHLSHANDVDQAWASSRTREELDQVVEPFVQAKRQTGQWTQEDEAGYQLYRQEKFDLILEFHTLRKNPKILGETIFDDGAVVLYDQIQRQYRMIAVRAGTILIDERLCDPSKLGRLRFTCAHELAHWVLHKKLYSGTGDVAAYNGNVSSDESHGIIERQADTLASALLMPLPQIKKCFYRLRIGRTDEQLIAEMANIFEVSKQAMQIRLKSRNLI